MKRKFISTVVGVSVVLLSLVGAPAYGRGGGHGGGGHGGGFSGGGTLRAELVVATVEPGLAMVLAAMARAITHPESQRDATAATAAMRLRTKHYAPRSSTGGQIYRSSPSSQSRTASRQFARSPKYSGSYYVPRDQSATGFARKSGIQQRAGTTAKGATRPDRAWSRQNAANRQRLDPQTTQRLRNWQGKAPG